MKCSETPLMFMERMRFCKAKSFVQKFLYEETMENAVLPEIHIEKRTIPFYKCICHNDNHNSFDHVIKTFIEVFHFQYEEAVIKTREVHEKGLSIVAIEPKEHAEFHRDKLQSASLTATIERA